MILSIIGMLAIGLIQVVVKGKFNFMNSWNFIIPRILYHLKKVFFLSLLFFHFLVDAQGVCDNEILNEIKILTNDSLRKSYLERIHNSDQYYRNYRNDLIDSLNRNSIVVSHASLDMMLNDVLNFKRIILFIEQFGYPTSQNYGEYAADAAWLVLHHNYGMPYKYLSYSVLKNAWIANNLETEKFDFFMRSLLKNFIKADEELSLQKLIEIADSQIN